MAEHVFLRAAFRATSKRMLERLRQNEWSTTLKELRMNGFNSVVAASGLALTVAALVAASDAQAAVEVRILSANAVSYCQTALPVFDGQVRKRPLAVQNEGAANTFVTCAFVRHSDSSSLFIIEMFASNNSSTAQSLTCTLVAGTASLPSNQFISKTVTLLPGDVARSLQWTQGDFVDRVFPTGVQYSTTCNLAPGIGLNDSYLVFTEEVGD